MRDALRQETTPKSLTDVLVGIEVGVLGGLAMLLWFAVAAMMMNRPWWLVWHLMASKFYHPWQLFSGPGMPTLVGAAVQLLAAGVVGLLNGLLGTGRRSAAVGIALLWYLANVLLVWKRTAPLMLSAQAPAAMVALGYVVFAFVLGLHPKLLKEARSSADPEARVGY